jgi:hypothetical protein
MVLDPRYLKGIDHFNRGEFFDAHEVWEDVWREREGPDRSFLQGLIQMVTALHHFERGNLKGARALVESGTDHLKTCGEFFWGLPVNIFVNEMTKCMTDLLLCDARTLPGRAEAGQNKCSIRLKRIPKINLVESPLP